MALTNWLFWERIREFTRSNRLYRHEGILQDQSAIDRITASGGFAGQNYTSSILDQTNLQINRLERYRDFEQMDQVGELSLALDLFADELSLIDPEYKHSIIIRAKNRRLKEELESFLYDTLQIDSWLRPCARYLCKFGDSPWEVILTQNRDGVSALKFMDAYNFTRVETKFGDLVGFFFQSDGVQEPTFLHPWACMHLRLTNLENIYAPYGKCISIYTPIWTGSGYKMLKDLVPGDSIYSHTGLKIVKSKVVKCVTSGRKQSVIVRTKNRSIMVTPEHLFMAIHNGKKYYIRACDLTNNDSVVVAKVPGEEVVISPIDNNFKLPKIVDAEFARLIGFVFGKSTITNTAVYLSTTNINWYLATLRSYGCFEEPITDNFGVAIPSMELVELFNDLNVTKVPYWLFKVDASIKKAFMQGMYDACGKKVNDRYVITCSDEDAINIKVALEQGGIAAIVELGSVSWTCLEPGDPFLKCSTLEQVTEVVDGPMIMVGDIQVDSDEHNFVAAGFVVHNSILDGSRKAFKQLRLMEDGALVYRVVRAPERRIYKIPVGDLPTNQVYEYLNGISRMLKRQRFYNPSTGTLDERYSPLTMEDDFVIPVRPDGTGPDIDTLPGAENLDQIKDIEYFQRKMIAPLKIPFSRVGIGGDAGQANQKSLSQEDADFAKGIKWIQSEIKTGITKACIIHLALRGFTISDIKSFSLSLAASSAIDDLYRMETWSTRVSVISDLKDIGWFPKAWIVTRFTDLSPDEIEELEEMQEIEKGSEEGEESGGGGGGGSGGGIGLGGGLDFDGGEGGDDEAGDEDMGSSMLGMDDEFEPSDDDEQDNDVEESTFYDVKREKKIINEMNRQSKRIKRLRYLMKQRDRKIDYTNACTNLIESNELAGLTASTLIFENKIDEASASEVINEYARAIGYTISE